MTAPLPKPMTHGRHCRCSACGRQDWSDPMLAPCDIHGPSCPSEYQPETREDWEASHPEFMARKTAVTAPLPLTPDEEAVVDRLAVALPQLVAAWDDGKTDNVQLAEVIVRLVSRTLDAERAARPAIELDGPYEDGSWGITVHRDGQKYVTGGESIADVIANAAEAWPELAIAFARAAIDRERLARALSVHFGPSFFPGMTDVTIFGKDEREVAAAIAAAYEAEP